MKIDRHIAKRRKATLNHLNRIQGQIETLKRYVETDADCVDVAMLTTSVAKSFDSLRSRTLEGSIVHQVLKGKKGLTRTQLEQIRELIKLSAK